MPEEGRKRSPGGFYAFTIAGLEEVAAQEIAACLVEARITDLERGLVHFEYSGDVQALLTLGTTEDVFALVAKGRVSRERNGLRATEEMVRRSARLVPATLLARGLKRKHPRGITYRVIAQRPDGPYEYRRVDLQASVSRAVQGAFPNWKEVPDDAHIEVWVLQRDVEVLCGVRLSDRTMRHRRYKKNHLEASLRPTIARSMVILSDPQPDDVYLDPMCGAGTLVIERGEHARYRYLLGGDIREEAVAATAGNIGRKYQPVSVLRWDAKRLPLSNGCVSRIACNLPFGKKVGSPYENVSLYRTFVEEASRVLMRPSRMILLTSEIRLLRAAVEPHADMRICRVRHITVLGQNAAVFQIDVLP
jgi:23S rRNA G2445 N2-methylase RlmL